MKYSKAKVKDLILVWEFKNECGEEFKILHKEKGPLLIFDILYITGDEFDWELVELKLIQGKKSTIALATNNWFNWLFLFEKEELIEILEIINEYNPGLILKI